MQIGAALQIDRAMLNLIQQTANGYAVLAGAHQMQIKTHTSSLPAVHVEYARYYQGVFSGREVSFLLAGDGSTTLQNVLGSGH